MNSVSRGAEKRKDPPGDVNFGHVREYVLYSYVCARNEVSSLYNVMPSLAPMKGATAAASIRVQRSAFPVALASHCTLCKGLLLLSATQASFGTRYSVKVTFKLILRHEICLTQCTLSP